MTPRKSYENVPGNYYDKYNTKNPIARRLVNGFRSNLIDLACRTQAKRVFEIGCGEGELSIDLLKRGFDVHGCDLEADVVSMANRRSASEGFGSRFTVTDIYDLDTSKYLIDLVVCCEVLEHLPEPKRALEIISQISCSWILLSVPREPIWRVLNLARGRYIRDLGNTPGHIQHWSSREFLNLVREHFDIVEFRRPLPWTMALCRPRKHKN